MMYPVKYYLLTMILFIKQVSHACLLEMGIKVRNFGNVKFCVIMFKLDVCILFSSYRFSIFTMNGNYAK